ncbi:hypothetical protein WDZ92_38420, partial [Nostoc sp. NIES-2111]
MTDDVLTSSNGQQAMNIVLLSSGEWPSTGSLLFSQVYETALSLRKEGYSVRWLATIPTVSLLKSLLLRRNDLQNVREACRVAGLPFDYAVIPVSLGSPISLPLRSFWLRRAAHRLIARGSLRNLEGSVVLHGRSYDATELALKLRDHLRVAGVKVIASFDMRSWLPPEIPMNHSVLGRLAYGPWKEIEHRLLKESDTRFLPLEISRRHYSEETGVAITFAPIQGFERPIGWSANFDERWQARRIG